MSIPGGGLSIAALFLSFFFGSLMFPTIFALGFRGLGVLTKKASAFLIMSIVGGAIMPVVMGWIADQWSMRIGFIMPPLCFVVIALYAAFWNPSRPASCLWPSKSKWYSPPILGAGVPSSAR